MKTETRRKKFVNANRVVLLYVFQLFVSFFKQTYYEKHLVPLLLG